jgi:glycosyltransferase involved in cell wall biosynthesis
VSERPFLLDVSRLVWRAWRGGLPTGIDRVCQAYVEHFGAQSQAVVQRRGFHFVLSPADSDLLFRLLLAKEPVRRTLLTFAVGALLRTVTTSPRPGSLYLNVGHTGLNEPSLPSWIARHRLRAVYLIHDLIPLTHPHFCRDGEAEMHKLRMNNVLASAAGVIGNSQATVHDLADFAEKQHHSMPPSVVAWLGAEDFPHDPQTKSGGKPYFVVVGTIEGRKNHQLLLDIWRDLVADRRQEAPLLVIIGQRGWQANEVFDQLDRPGELEGHVLELGSCDDDDLAGWIAGARALLMPSFAEGFGLPVMEALQLGTPVIVTDLPVYREIAGDRPVYLSPTDKAGWKSAVKSLARGPQSKKMPDFRAPTWQDHFTTVEAWLKMLSV